MLPLAAAIQGLLLQLDEAVSWPASCGEQAALDASALKRCAASSSSRGPQMSDSQVCSFPLLSEKSMNPPGSKPAATVQPRSIDPCRLPGEERSGRTSRWLWSGRGGSGRHFAFLTDPYNRLAGYI